MKKLFLLTFTSVIFAFYVIQYWPVTVRIQGSSEFSIKMPYQDKRDLDYFFRDACFVQGWAYTMMGSKPMSTFQYIEPWIRFKRAVRHPDLKEFLVTAFFPPNIHRIYWLFDPVQLKLKKGCKTLRKYMKYFPDSRLAFFSAPGNGIEGLLIVNKPNLIRIVKDNLEDFSATLEALGIAPEDLLNNENLDLFLKGLNNDDERIRGTILGYGRNNAWLYEKYTKMKLDEFPMEFIWSKDSHDAWIDQINDKELSFQSWNYSDLFYPCFICDPLTEESKQLRQRYQEDKVRIIEYYKGRDIVEATLSLFY